MGRGQKQKKRMLPAALLKRVEEENVTPKA
jgi:hypothetical protein